MCMWCGYTKKRLHETYKQTNTTFHSFRSQDDLRNATVASRIDKNLLWEFYAYTNEQCCNNFKSIRITLLNSEHEGIRNDFRYVKIVNGNGFCEPTDYTTPDDTINRCKKLHVLRTTTRGVAKCKQFTRSLSFPLSCSVTLERSFNVGRCKGFFIRTYTATNLTEFLSFICIWQHWMAVRHIVLSYNYDIVPHGAWLSSKGINLFFKKCSGILKLFPRFLGFFFWIFEKYLSYSFIRQMTRMHWV